MSGRSHLWCVSNNSKSSLDKKDTYSPIAATTTTMASTTTNTDQIITLIAKFDYKASNQHELDLKKNEKLLLIDSSKQWWLVQKLVDSSQQGYIPSNYVKKEKRSLLDKLISKKSSSSSSSTSTSTSYQSKNVKESSSNDLLQQNENKSNHNSSSLSNYSGTFSQSNSNNQLNTTSCLRAVVKHKYTAKKADELTLLPNTQVIILNKYEDGWWRVELTSSVGGGGVQTGLYPSNYLEEITSSSEQQQLLSTNKKISTSSSNANNSSVHSDNSLDKINELLCAHDAATTTPNVCTKIGDSISSSERDIEYVQCIYAYKSKNDSNELSISTNEILKVIDDEDVYLNNDYNTSFIRVMNNRGTCGLIPSSCVQPVINAHSFLFIRRPCERGLFARRQWYYGKISRYETNLMLNKFGVNGDFMIRDSEREIGNYSISLKSDNINNKHFKILYKDGNFMIGKKMFTSMDELIEHYKMNPIFDQNNEKLFLIKAFESP